MAQIFRTLFVGDGNCLCDCSGPITGLDSQLVSLLASASYGFCADCLYWQIVDRYHSLGTRLWVIGY